ncbi:MAG: acetyltransferase [Proteobacteria bacterium]|nr:acetyltransferase [Pseudomonadota bacterium]
MKKKLIIIGVGETANLAYEYFTLDSDYEVAAFAVNREYRREDTFRNCPVVDFEDIEKLFPPADFEVFVAMGSGELNYARTRMYQQTKNKGYRLASYVSSRAFVWHNVKIGENCFILEGNTLQPFTSVGNNVVMWSGNHLGHQSVVRDNCFITSHVVISGYCEIGHNTFIGVNASIADNVKIAPDNFIAMGCVINKSTKENSIYKGNPATAAAISAKYFCNVKE